MTATAQLAPYTWDWDTDDDGHTTYNTRWRVVATSADIGPDTIRTAANLPLPGTPFSSIVAGGNPFAYCLHKCSGRIKEEDKHRAVWDVSLPFTTKGTKRCTNTQVGNPLLEPWKISGGGNKWIRAAQKDKDGNPICNSAKQRFRGEIVQIDETRPTYRIAGNVAWISVPVLNSVRNAVNSVAFWGCAIRTLKIAELTWEQRWYGSCAWYFGVNISIEYNEDTWDLVPLDEGDLILDPDDSTKWMVPKDSREQTLHRVLLDGEGGIGDPTNPVYCDGGGSPARPGPFRVRKEVSFATVGFPASLPGLV